MVCVRIVCADIPALLERFNQQGLVLYDIRCVDCISAEFVVSYNHLRQLRKIVHRSNCKLEIVWSRGLEQTLKSLKTRYVFLTMLIALLFLSVWLPSRVLFISVDGNRTIPTVRILQQAERCGIYFGAKRSAVRSEIVKNSLLESIPELRWAGINTSGCTAVISVREDIEKDESEDVKYSNLIAEKDGVILSITATSGYPVCGVGQAVKAGQVLISGSQSEGVLLKTTRAVGEVFAQTNRNLQVVTPVLYENKMGTMIRKTYYSLILGKKRINLSKGSGISPTGCGKMYQEYHLILPGGFVLPIALALETVTQYHTDLTCVSDPDAETFLEECAVRYLSGQMVSGRIIAKETIYSSQGDVGMIEAEYRCIEMIARERQEELEIYYGKEH